MEKEKLDYMVIQTSPDVWSKILELNPIHPDEVFLEAFSGENSLYDQVDTNKKEWCEITKGRDIFDYDFENSDVTVIYTNPPFKCDIPNKKGEMKYKNCVFFFLEYFMTRLKHLKTLGFLINAKSFCSLTPNRLHQLEQLGFSISNITVLNTNYWYGCYYFILFERGQTNKCVKIIPKTFTEKSHTPT
jgi:hypothetical protein